MRNSTSPAILCPIKTPHGVLMLPTLPMAKAMQAAKELHPGGTMQQIQDVARVIQLRYAIQQQTLETELQQMIQEINEKYSPQTSG